jgi:transposase
MSRYKPLIERTKTDRIKLEGIVQNPFADPDLTIRAKAILMFLDGSKGDQIAKALSVRPNTISDWRKRYESDGVEGLYDKTPKGKRGSETRNQVLEKLKETPPVGGWSTQALADAVGTSRDTVRRALKEQHLTVSKTTIWDHEIPKSPGRAYIEAIGLYLSKEEAGMIVQVDSISFSGINSYGYVTTRNRSLAQSLTKLEQSGFPLSLDNALQASLEQMKEVPRGDKETFQIFLNDILTERKDTDANCQEKQLFYVFYWCDKQKNITPILQRSGIIVKMTNDVSGWTQMIEPWIGILSLSKTEPVDNTEIEHLISSINRYMDKTTTLVEPFEWRRIIA